MYRKHLHQRRRYGPLATICFNGGLEWAEMERQKKGARTARLLYIGSELSRATTGFDAVSFVTGMAYCIPKEQKRVKAYQPYARHVQIMGSRTTFTRVADVGLSRLRQKL